MKTKQLLLGLVVVNLIGLGVLIYRRQQYATVTSEAAVGPTQVERRVVLPPRPQFEEPATASDMHAQIAAQRGLAFDIAEFTVSRLPANPGALCLLGKLHVRYGDPEGAQQLWDEAIRLDADFAEPYLDYGHMYEKLGQTEQAEQSFREALARDPRSIDAYTALNAVLLTAGKFADATDSLRKLLNLQPQAVPAWCQLGQAYQQLGEFDKSIQAYLQALHLDAKSREAALGLMAAYRSQGDSENAARAAERFAAIDAAYSRTSEDRDVVNRDRDKMEDVLAFTAQVAGRLLAQAGDAAAAIAQLEGAYRVAPGQHDLRAQLADYYFRVSRFDDALGVLRDACERQPESLTAWWELAQMSLKCRRLETAEEAARRFIALDPENAAGYALLAQTLMPANRNPQAAVENARRAVSLSPSAGHHYILATALYNAGDLASTKTELETAITLDPDNAEYRAALGRIQ